jgi:NAD-dependent SIR2 family protein deacetylase
MGVYIQQWHIKVEHFDHYLYSLYTHDKNSKLNLPNKKKKKLLLLHTQNIDTAWKAIWFIN